ncbi:MAG: biotin synthase BioB [Candidatus Gastranaerophilaceae bacterium]|jgi:biotin synthase
MSQNTKIKELLELYDLPVEELINISSEITKENFSNTVEFCSIISAKTGKCGEDCKYCSQSGHHKAKIEVHPLISVQDVKASAESAKENGASRFCVVTSGRKPEADDFKNILKMIELVANIDGLHSCCSLGILDEKQVKQIKEAGAERYNHNLNTCKSFHKDICSTHDYEDRINTVKLIQSYGIEACTGGIIGMGETRRQRVELALELAELNPVSVPVNFLHPVVGTPLENKFNAITEEEILKTLAIFRIVLPKALIRYAGGRFSRFSKESQLLGIKAGVNALLVGNYLTTTGITPDDDIKLIQNAGMSIEGASTNG